MLQFMPYLALQQFGTLAIVVVIRC